MNIRKQMLTYPSNLTRNSCTTCGRPRGGNNDQTATAGTVDRTGNTLTWAGDLAVGQTVTITYSVDVTAAGPAQLRNVVTSPDERAICDPEGVCVTQHDVPAPPPGLAVTGGTIAWTAGGLAALLVLAGAALLIHRRRHPQGRLGEPVS